MHKSDLDLLIEEYETEKRHLESLIEECLKEWDYKGADWHSKALRKVNRLLQTLHNFKNPFHDEKKFLEWDRESLQQMKVEDVSNEESYDKWINEIDEKIEKLKEKKVSFQPQTQEFDDAIYDLVERKIKGFRFHLKKEDSLYLDFKLTEKNILLISFTSLNNITNEYCITDWNWKQLKLIGFEFDPESNSFQYSYDLATFRNSIFLKELVSRIVFDAFYIKDLDNPAYIDYK